MGLLGDGEGVDASVHGQGCGQDGWVEGSCGVEEGRECREKECISQSCGLAVEVGESAFIWGAVLGVRFSDVEDMDVVGCGIRA